MSYHDRHHLARLHNHLSWKAEVDFEKKIIKAIATYKIENKSNVKEIILDTKNLTIGSVSTNDQGKVAHDLKEADPIKGSALHIPITENTTTISIQYETTAVLRSRANCR